jgi:antirestriction protein
MSYIQGADTMDSRDIDERIEELEDAEDEDEKEELKTLIAFREDVNSREWKYGIQFIRESYFETFAQELAEDIGAMQDCNSWPATCIDWERAARELQMDYSSAELDGDTYLYRS